MVSGLHRMGSPGPRSAITLVRHAEQAGLDEFLFGDHVVLGGDMTNYPYGEFSFGGQDGAVRPEEPWPEVLTMLAAAAVATEQIRIGSGVLLAALRPAVLLAKVAATIDQLCHGRLTLGVGLGWLHKEFEALGVPVERRFAALTDTVRACRLLWTQLPASFESPTVTFRDVYCSPQPAQHPLPIWLGSKMTAKRAAWIAELADGWFPLQGGPREIAAGAALLRDAFAGAGRDPAGMGIRTWASPVLASGGRVDVTATREAARPLVEAGAGTLWFALGPHLGMSSLRDVQDFLDQLAPLATASWT